MRIDILTLFPEMFAGVLGQSILKRAQEKGLVEIILTNIRDFAEDKYRSVDDSPYGGGPGMVMMCGPVFAAAAAVAALAPPPDEVILLTPQGEPFRQGTARDLARRGRLMLIAGHYEGFDERIRQHLATRELSLGDYVLSGGEIPALAVVDAVVRLLPGALGDDESCRQDSFSQGLLEYPQYTRPADFRGWQVPDELLSGNHALIRQWRGDQARRRTRQRRPDLYCAAPTDEPTDKRNPDT